MCPERAWLTVEETIQTPAAVMLVPKQRAVEVTTPPDEQRSEKGDRPHTFTRYLDTFLGARLSHSPSRAPGPAAT